MKIKDQKDKRFQQYSNLCETLYKKSSNPILGFQPKKWEIFDKGKKIAYMNIKDIDYKDENIFLIKQCEVSEASAEDMFQLTIKDRSFILKGQNKQIRDKWIQAITYLKQLPRRQKKMKKKDNQILASNTTLATTHPNNESKINPEDMSFHTHRSSNTHKQQLKKQNFPNKFHKSKVEESNNQNTTIIPLEKSEKSNSEPVKFYNKLAQSQTNFAYSHNPEDLKTKVDYPAKMNKIIQQLSKYLHKNYIKYNVMLTLLRKRQEGFFNKASYSIQQIYLLISSKSLYPKININPQNLTNLSLPPWIEVNILFLVDIIDNKFISKPICQVNKIIDIELSQQDNSFKINTGQILYDFLAQTKEQRQCIKNCLKISTLNVQESIIDGKISKFNYDKLVQLHEISDNQFHEQVQKIIAKLLPELSIKNIEGLLDFLKNFNAFVKDFLHVMSHKKQTPQFSITKTIQNTIKILYEELKIQTKLTWDSLYPKRQIQTIQILSILQLYSDFSVLTKGYVRIEELIEGMKQFSKIFVRDTWKSFRQIILNIVEQERKGSFQNQFSEYGDSNLIKTNGVIDLFKLIYDTFEIAIPHWNSKIHLRNVSKLIVRALQVYVFQIRSMVDQQYLTQRQLIGIANNYFDFNQQTKQFYEKKISQLHENTEEEYKSITSSYRQISLVIIEKLSKQTLWTLDSYFQDIKLIEIKSDQIFNKIIEASEQISKGLHMAFQKKFYDKIAIHVCSHICDCVVKLAENVKNEKEIKKKQKKNKKKNDPSVYKSTQISQYLRIINEDLAQIFKHLGKSHLTYSRNAKQIVDLLTCQLHSDIKVLIDSTKQSVKPKYLMILNLREDYYPQSVLYEQVNSELMSRPRQKSVRIRTPTTNKHRKGSEDYSGTKKIRKLSYTLMYQQQQMAGSQDDKSDTSSIYHKSDNQKLISCGYIMKGKRNKKLFQKVYLRLKNGILYIYEEEESVRPSNQISVQKIVNLQIKHQQKPSFLLTYKNQLERQKQIKLRCDSVQLRNRWMTSLRMQIKRIQNQEKLKKKKLVKNIEGNTGRKKNQFIIDYWELEQGNDYFSYSQV